MVFALNQSNPRADQRQDRSTSPWPPIQLAALIGLGLMAFVPLPQWSQESAADAAITAVNRPQPSWYQADYRAWKQSSAWKPQINSFFWDRFSCGSNQTCLPIKVLSREDCDVLSVAASLVNPSTGQTVLAKARIETVPAGQEQNLTLRWNLPPGQANETLVRETLRKSTIDTLADRAGNSSLVELAQAHISAKLIPAAAPWRAVTIQDIRCL